MKKTIPSVVAALLLAVICIGWSRAQAQSVSIASGIQRPASCIPFEKEYRFGIGARDSWTGGEVSYIQAHLGIIQTGYFGPLTSAALRSFQISHGISGTGYVGPLTQASLRSIICGSSDDTGVSNVPAISYISPSIGAVGSSVTITGTGFASKSYVLFDGGPAGGALVSNDGTHLTFTVPGAVGAPCNLFTAGSACPMYMRLISLGNHVVTVETANGTSNAVNFTVTSSTAIAAPTISYLTPTSGPAGTIVTIHGSGFTSTGNTVNFADAQAWGAGTYSNSIASPDGTTLSFIVPSSKGMCPPNAYCTMVYWQPYQPGSYQVSVTNANGVSSAASFMMTGASTSAVPAITSISPSAGSVGTQVTVTGSGFDSKSYALIDGYTAAGPLVSSDGTHLAFTVPSYLTPQCGQFSSTPVACSAIALQLSQGTHSLSVITANGTSNSVNFNVTGSAVSDSGITGNVTLGPTCPVQSYPPQAQCADRPYSAALLISGQNSSYSATVTSDNSGRFSVSLPAGTYVISQQGSATYPRLSPQTVTAYANSYATANLMFDSGIR